MIESWWLNQKMHILTHRNDQRNRSTRCNNHQSEALRGAFLIGKAADEAQDAGVVVLLVSPTMMADVEVGPFQRNINVIQCISWVSHVLTTFFSGKNILCLDFPNLKLQSFQMSPSTPTSAAGSVCIPTSRRDRRRISRRCYYPSWDSSCYRYLGSPGICGNLEF
jgi:hypothetical protein